MWSVIQYLNTSILLSNLFYSLVILITTMVALRIVRVLFKKALYINPDDNSFEDLLPFLENLARIGLLALTTYFLLKVWGIDVTPLIASAGVAGVALAFAAQDTVSNFFGGIAIFTDKPFKLGDQILIDGKHRGHVYKIGARSTKIKTVDNVLVTIPNSVIANNAIYNETGYDPKMRLRVEVGISYGTDLEKAEKVLMQVLRENKNILEDPEPLVLFTAFSDSSINVMLVGTVANPQMIPQVTHEVVKQTYKVLRDVGIEIPFPQRDIHLYTEDHDKK